jgi:3D (Asp-Asp-Asp) domain-containing protein
MQEATALSPSRRMARGLVSALPFIGLASLVSYSAILAKEAGRATPLVEIDAVRLPEAQHAVPAFEGATPDQVLPMPQAAQTVGAPVRAPATGEPAIIAEALAADRATGDHGPTAEVGTRWFNGRPIRPARTIMMTVTAYSPDARSCGDSADGVTATLHSVWTNGFKLVAADPKILPYGSMLSIAGYDNGQVVPVLDCGGAIKGKRLDVLFPTHEQARQWGIRKIPVVVWEYADGKPADDPRKQR